MAYIKDVSHWLVFNEPTEPLTGGDDADSAGKAGAPHLTTMHHFIGQYLIARGLWHIIWYHGHQILILVLALYFYGAYLNDDLGPRSGLLALLLCVAAGIWILRVGMRLYAHLVGRPVTRHHGSGHVQVRVDLDRVR